MNTQKGLIFLLLCLMFCFSLSGAAIHDDGLVSLANFKAVFIYNFTKYIEWPAIASDASFSICVLGKSNIVAPLEIIAEKRKINGKSVKILQIDDPDQIEAAQILFIAQMDDKELKDILEKAEEQSILTISDIEGAADWGIAINLVLLEGKIKFELNQKAIQEAGLTVSSQLLKLAILVE